MWITVLIATNLVSIVLTFLITIISCYKTWIAGRLLVTRTEEKDYYTLNIDNFDKLDEMHYILLQRVEK